MLFRISLQFPERMRNLCLPTRLVQRRRGLLLRDLQWRFVLFKSGAELRHELGLLRQYIYLQ